MNKEKMRECILSLTNYIGTMNAKTLLLTIQKFDIEYFNDFLDMIIVKLEVFYNTSLIDENTYKLSLEHFCNFFKQEKITIKKLENRLKWLNEMNLKNNFGLQKNHKQIYEIFDEFNKLLEFNKIEHYYTSGILSFILVNKPLERYHHDLDVFVCEEQLEKLEQVAPDFNFSFVRKIGDRPDGTKRRIFKMYYKNLEIPITVFMYIRRKDGSIIQKDYFYDDSGNLMVEEIYNSPVCAQLSFSDIVNYHNNVPYKAISLEALYLCKNGGRPKDIYDCSIIFPYIDNEKLNKLNQELKIAYPTNTYEVMETVTKDFINGDSSFTKRLI